MLHKIDNILKFNSKRNRKLATPCCQKSNTNGKFVTYRGYPDHYGYCHSCGISTLPPTTYRDEKGEEFIWNDTTKQFENYVKQSSHNSVLQSCMTNENLCDNNVLHRSIKIKYVDFEIVNRYYNYPQENNLLKYLRTNYDSKDVDKVKKMYHIGTNKKLWTVFWMINKKGQAQKAKAIYYKKNGKRTNYFKVPYKNDDGYFSCLFGEHLLKENTKPIVLVESEKTAIVCSIVLPNYTWLAFGGINGLTNSKLTALKGQSIIIIPDMSRTAVEIIHKKAAKMKELEISANVFDMTDNKNDDELKKEGWYNCDIEDVFRFYKIKFII